MAKDFWIKFGSGDSRTNTGLTPTFVVFQTAGTTLTPPAITEPIAGTGMYRFAFGPTLGIAFQVDGGAALAAADRYVSGALDPIQAVDDKVGFITDSFGSSNIDPTTVMGFLKRNQEFEEGNALFNKSSGVWTVYTRGGSVIIMAKALSNTSTAATKT